MLASDPPTTGTLNSPNPFDDGQTIMFDRSVHWSETDVRELHLKVRFVRLAAVKGQAV